MKTLLAQNLIHVVGGAVIYQLYSTEHGRRYVRRTEITPNKVTHTSYAESDERQQNIVLTFEIDGAFKVFRGRELRK